jgi:hypothetical protein
METKSSRNARHRYGVTLPIAVVQGGVSVRIRRRISTILSKKRRKG